MPTITPQIVIVTASVVTAPQVSTLQQSGAIVSVGGSTLATNAYQYCGNLAAVTAILGSSGNHVELLAMATTFFAQGSAAGLYVLELGTVGSSAAGITALGNWITANSSPQIFYAYLVPATWDVDGAAALNTLAATYSSPTGKTYFFVTTTAGTMSAYAATTKAVIALVNSPTAAGTEFQAAALFYQWLANDPGAATPAAPMDFRFVFGVTPWVFTNNRATIQSIISAYVNLILTGAEGGISTALLRNGTTMDGNQAMFWYAVDWILINADEDLAAAVINGSNTNPPLYYNQAGINTLLSVARVIATASISFGLCLSATVTAVPFSTYVAANPSDYAAGVYKGFACTATPQNGFRQITFNLTATQFAA
jgi:hypothetical protein